MTTTATTPTGRSATQVYENGAKARFRIRGIVEEIELTTAYASGARPLYPRATTNDYPQYEGEQLSCDTQPEHELVYVNQINPYNNGLAPDYDILAYLTMHIQAGREFTSFSDLSAYIKRGLLVRRLVTDDIVACYYTQADYREQYQDPDNAPSRLPEALRDQPAPRNRQRPADQSSPWRR